MQCNFEPLRVRWWIMLVVSMPFISREFTVFLQSYECVAYHIDVCNDNGNATNQWVMHMLMSVSVSVYIEIRLCVQHMDFTKHFVCLIHLCKWMISLVWFSFRANPVTAHGGHGWGYNIRRYQWHCYGRGPAYIREEGKSIVPKWKQPIRYIQKTYFRSVFLSSRRM